MRSGIVDMKNSAAGFCKDKSSDDYGRLWALLKLHGGNVVAYSGHLDDTLRRSSVPLGSDDYDSKRHKMLHQRASTFTDLHSKYLPFYDWTHDLSEPAYGSSSRRKSPKRKSGPKSPKRKSPKRKSARKSPKRKSARKSPKRKSARKSPKRKSARKSPKRKSARKSAKGRYRGSTPMSESPAFRGSPRKQRSDKGKARSYYGKLSQKDCKESPNGHWNSKSKSCRKGKERSGCNLFNAKDCRKSRTCSYVSKTSRSRGYCRRKKSHTINAKK